MFSNFLSANRAIYEIVLKNMLEPDRPQVKIQSSVEKILFACQTTKARIQTLTHIHTHTHTHTHSQTLTHTLSHTHSHTHTHTHTHAHSFTHTHSHIH